MTRIPAAWNTASNACVKVGVAVMQDEFRSRPGIPKVHEQVPGLLDGPGLDRVLRGAQDPDAPAAVHMSVPPTAIADNVGSARTMLQPAWMRSSAGATLTKPPRPRLLCPAVPGDDGRSNHQVDHCEGRDRYLGGRRDGVKYRIHHDAFR
jgi:hypothetical protein